MLVFATDPNLGRGQVLRDVIARKVVPVPGDPPPPDQPLIAEFVQLEDYPEDYVLQVAVQYRDPLSGLIEHIVPAAAENPLEFVAQSSVGDVFYYFGTEGNDSRGLNTTNVPAQATQHIRMRGYGGNDTLSALSPLTDVRIFGGGGNDTLDGTGNADFLYGGAGEDTIHGRGGSDFISGEGENDILYGELNALTSSPGQDTIYGGDGNDQLYGDFHVIVTNGAKDTLIPGFGADLVYGGGATGNNPNIVRFEDADDGARDQIFAQLNGLASDHTKILSTEENALFQINLDEGDAVLGELYNGGEFLVKTRTSTFQTVAINRGSGGILRFTEQVSSEGIPPQQTPVSFTNNVAARTEFHSNLGDISSANSAAEIREIMDINGWIVTADAGAIDFYMDPGNSHNLKRLDLAGTVLATVHKRGAGDGPFNGTLSVNSLGINTTSTNVPKLDLTNNDIIIRASSTTKNALLDALEADILTAMNGTDPNLIWNFNGPGLTSSYARNRNVAHGMNLVSIGAIRNSDLQATQVAGTNPPYPTFGGQTVDLDCILVKTTYVGDLDLSGHVTFSHPDGGDVGIFNRAFGGEFQFVGWATGDVDYDGFLTFDDATIIDGGLNFQTQPL
jgi:hypothetical protein